MIPHIETAESIGIEIEDIRSTHHEKADKMGKLVRVRAKKQMRMHLVKL